MEYFKKELKRWNKMYGRTSKHDFWMFIMYYLIISFILMTLSFFDTRIQAFHNLYYYFMIPPLMTAQIRRFHDINRSGKLLLLNFIPLFGQIYLLYLLAKNGDEFLNKYDYILKYDEIPTGKNCGDSLSEIKENNNYEKQVLLNIESKNDSELNFRGNVPNINDDWEKISKYAIEIDFYDYWGSKDKFFEVVEKIKNDYDYFDSIPKSPVKLRTFLFYLQKRIRFNNKGQIPNDQEWKVINKILKKLSSKDV